MLNIAAALTEFIRDLCVYVMISLLLPCFLGVVSVVGVQGSSSTADQPEHGAAERGEGPPSVSPDRQSEALAGAGLVAGEQTS